MRAIDANKLKSKIVDNNYILKSQNNTTDFGMFTVGIFQAIDEQDKLPTTQSNSICDYCSNPKCSLCGNCMKAGYADFKGKKVIEVK